ncbi:hypothetical protein ACO1O0_003064 [Amphichorda felina]
MRFHQFIWSAYAASASAQYVGWQDEQVNTSICSWYQPRAALIRDTVYLDGGTVYWTPGLSNGVYGSPESWGNPRGVIFSYNLSNPFDADTNVTKLLIENTISKAIGGEGNANGAAPNFIDGGMLANDAEFYMYGGALFRNGDLYDDPDADYVLGYRIYSYGPEKPAFDRGFDPNSLPDGVNRYVAYGAAVSAPSENKAWYFSGMKSESGGDIYSADWKNRTHAPRNMSNTMIELDMESQIYEKWSEKELPKAVKGRANAEVVWVPVGKQGILVVLGGVVYPEWAGYGHESENKDANKKESPVFMRKIDIYDIENEKWYSQETEDGPTETRSRGCAVVAPASDYSSFNIYYYGGNDGLNHLDPFSDDVWVLSLPSFTWTLLNKGNPLHARAGHKCFMPYPDQMMAFGGDVDLAGRGKRCLKDGPIVNFNLTSGEWMDSYHPDRHSKYGVPDKVREVIGGHASGGATLTTPSPSGWATDALEDIFSSSYDMDKITTWGPYKAEETESNRPDLPNNEDDGGSGGGSGLPSWVAPVLGVVLGLMVVTAAIVVFCLWRRRKIIKNRSSDYGTEDSGNRIISWIRGQPTEKAVTIPDDTTMSPEIGEAKTVERAPSAISPPPPVVAHHEMGGTPIAELDGNIGLQLFNTYFG